MHDPPPRRPRTPRERLAALLDTASESPLTVVCAPAGYGKTTAVLDWLASRGRRSSRLTIDTDDNEVEHLFPRLLGISADLAGAYGEDFSVVIDDFHLLTEPASHRAVQTLLTRLPAGVQTIVLSRTPPPLRLGRRRAIGDVADIGPTDLAFTAAEAEALLNGSFGLGLDADQLRQVDSSVAGWAAGLGLIGTSLPGDPTAERFASGLELARTRMGQYLREEVLEDRGPALREFLLRSSILDRLHPSVCAAVLEDPEAGELLAEVRRQHLLIAAPDDADGWVRLQRPFPEILRRELRASDIASVPTLHRRASRWFEDEGMFAEAIGHASLAGDGHRAAALVFGAGDRLLDGGGYRSAWKLIEAMPADRGAYGPYSQAIEVLAHSRDRGNPRHAFERLRQLRSEYGDAPGVAGLVDRALISPFFGQVAATATAGRTLLDRSRERPLSERAELAARLGVVEWFDGDPDAARALLDDYLDAMDGHWHDIALAALSLLAVDEGDLELAVRRAEEAFSEVVPTDGDLGLDGVFVCQALANGLIATGRHGDADRVLTHAEAATGEVPDSLYEGFTQILRAELELRRHDRPRAERAAAEARTAIDRHPDPGVLAIRLDEAEKALAGGGPGELRGSHPTPAEQRVLDLLGSSLTFKEIAADLFVSIHTVKSHSQRLYRRLGVNSREAAVEVATERGLLD